MSARMQQIATIKIDICGVYGFPLRLVDPVFYNSMTNAGKRRANKRRAVVEHRTRRIGRPA